MLTSFITGKNGGRFGVGIKYRLTQQTEHDVDFLYRLTGRGSFDKREINEQE